MIIETDYRPEAGEPLSLQSTSPVGLVDYLDELNRRGVSYLVHVKSKSGELYSGPAFSVNRASMTLRIAVSDATDAFVGIHNIAMIRIEETE